MMNRSLQHSCFHQAVALVLIAAILWPLALPQGAWARAAPTGGGMPWRRGRSPG